MRRLLCIFFLLTVVFFSGCQKSNTTQKDNNQLLLIILSMSSALGLSPDDGCSSQPQTTGYVQPTVVDLNQPVSGQKQKSYRVLNMKRGDIMKFSKSIPDSTCEITADIYICSFFGKIDRNVSYTICSETGSIQSSNIELNGTVTSKQCTFNLDLAPLYQSQVLFYFFSRTNANNSCNHTFEVKR